MTENTRKKFLELLAKPYFTVSALAQMGNLSIQSARQTAARWYSSGKVFRLKEGYYMGRDFYLKNSEKPGFLELISSILSEPPLYHSFLSREYVLAKHNCITDAVTTITAVTTKNTFKITNNLDGKVYNFDFKHIKDELYLGFSQKWYLGIPVHEASKSKALFDYFYFKSLPRVPFRKDYNLAEDLRLNIADWSKDEIEEFKRYVDLCGMIKMKEVEENLERLVWQS
jgi:predicted transcriptional regulator of viral defense system